jgi:hypothetical protein
LAFLINSDRSFLCDSVADFAFFSNLLGGLTRARVLQLQCAILRKRANCSLHYPEDSEVAMQKGVVHMQKIRLISMVALMGLALAGSAVAQRPGPEFRRQLACEPLEPRTKLEAIDARYARVLIKGFTQVATLEARGGDLRIDAVELRDTLEPARAIGIVVAVRETADNPRENRALIDYDEIDSLIKALDTVARVNETTTKLTGFEARYRTNGDMEVNVFRQSRSGVASSLSIGICDRITVQLTLDDLNKLRGIVQEARTRLDEIK